ncbi:MAG: non-canonical purine NTP pyrophosphatase [Patescibacteria group bacterium]
MVKKKPKEVIFVTGNKYKFQVAQKATRGGAIKLIQKKLETPEIQAESVEDIAAFSAMWAADVLKKPVVVSDAGCHIDALNGFPGPFIKYIDAWLTPRDLLNTMKGKKNRKVVWKDCLAYCEPGKKPKALTCYFKGTLAQKAGKMIFRKEYGWMDRLFVPAGYPKTLSELPTEEYLAYWADQKSNDSWQKLIRYLK